MALHVVSDIGITGLLGAKLASFGYQHDHGLVYTLYLVTYALDSVGDVFGSLAALAASTTGFAFLAGRDPQADGASGSEPELSLHGSSIPIGTNGSRPTISISRRV